MHLENSKQRLAEQVNRWISTIQNSKTLPTAASANPMLESPDWWRPEFVDPAVEQAIQGFRKSRQVLDQLGEESDRGASGNSFVIPLGVVLDALPERYLQGEVSAAARQRPIRVFMEDLYEQLARGMIQVTVARLVFGVPVGLISSVALRDTSTKVTLPLRAVVDAIGTEALSERTVKAGRRPRIDHLPELFTPPAAAPVAPAADALPEAVTNTAVGDHAATPPREGEASANAEMPPAAAVVTEQPAPCVTELAAPPSPVSPPAVAEAVESQGSQVAGQDGDAKATTDGADNTDADVPVEAVPARPPRRAPRPVAALADVHISTVALERLNANGVDLNRATEAQLATLDGVTAATAREIVAYRQQHGPFADVFALADVPRVGRKTFRRITGMPYSRTGRHRGAVLARWLGLASGAQASLPALVQAVAAHPGLAGCVMSDREGLLLAESGAGEQAVTISAIVPRLVGQVMENIRELGGDGVHTVSVAYNGRLLTAVAAGDVYLTVLHNANRLTTGLHQFLRRIALELAWWFSRRGYVETEAPATEAGSHA